MTNVKTSFSKNVICFIKRGPRTVSGNARRTSFVRRGTIKTRENTPTSMRYIEIRNAAKTTTSFDKVAVWVRAEQWIF